ncbi:MAG: class I SAM-dependent methyltransferase [Gammaproteobacteria bacterium]|nr:MAG: class I SAM-dependent methyltransferase [Gammaproteobacteria bacterium]
MLTKLFLDYGNTVYGIEPNKAMREVGELYLAQYPDFHSMSGTAEATYLDAASIDFITVGTAFHWFDVEKTKQEFKRIARPHAWVVLVWNVRDIESPLIHEYENLLLEYGCDYANSNAKKLDKVAMDTFFKGHTIKTAAFKNIQYFNWEGFKGRLLSTSFIPRSEHAKYKPMIQQLKNIFLKYEKNGTIEFYTKPICIILKLHRIC